MQEILEGLYEDELEKDKQEELNRLVRELQEEIPVEKFTGFVNQKKCYEK